MEYTYQQLKKEAARLGIASYGVTKVKLEPLVRKALEAEKKPNGVVGGGHVIPPEPKPVVKLEPEIAEYKVGDVVQDVRTGEKFTIESVNGQTAARKVNQTENGMKFYNFSQLRHYK